MYKLKQYLKSVLQFFHIDVTQNMRYDRQTNQVLKKILTTNSSTIDVGCHKGEMLIAFLKAAPNGTHFAFEPIPELYQNLLQQFNAPNCKIYPYALAAQSGQAEFNHIKNAPAYSGLKQRHYDNIKPEIEKITVQVRTLDEIIDDSTPIKLLKIDVEGGEFGVLSGAKKLIEKHKPYIIFEFGLGASDFYQTKPEEIYALLVEEFGLKITTMKKWLQHQKEYSKEDFCIAYQTKKDYYFLAHP